jgi:hypothetical protein
MTERKLSAADAALRERIVELSEHIPCGGLRGPVDGSWQSCGCEDSPERWEGVRRIQGERPVHHLLQGDGRRHIALVVAGVRGLPPGQRVHREAGVEVWRSPIRPWPPQPNEQGRRPRRRYTRGSGGADRPAGGVRQRRRPATRMAQARYERLASRFDPLADIPLIWQAEWPPGPEASVNAFARLLGRAPDPPST